MFFSIWDSKGLYIYGEVLHLCNIELGISGGGLRTTVGCDVNRTSFSPVPDIDRWLEN